MKRLPYLLASISLVLFKGCDSGTPVYAQNTSVYGSVTAGASTCTPTSCVYYQLPPNTPWVVVSVAGTWVGQLNLYVVTSTTATYQNLNSQPSTRVGTITTDQNVSVASAGALFLVVNAPSWVSGSANVTLSASATGLPLINPAFAGQVTTTGVVGASGGNNTTCWTTNGGTATCLGGGVTSVNGIVGDLTIVGAGTNTVTQVGSTITITGTGGGGGGGGACSSGQYQETDTAPSGSLTGAINGTNNVYTLSHTPVSTVGLSYNGVVQALSTNYTVTGTTLTTSFYAQAAGGTTDMLSAAYCSGTP